MQANHENTNLSEIEPKGCPFSQSTNQLPITAPNGCPISKQAAGFDPFSAEYQQDPAGYLKWSRTEEPIFFNPTLGYWVVTKYEDVKSVFRDNISFSPANALEKITPFDKEAEDILKSYDYAMNRTLVNEDEPDHLERRRALMHSFTPEELKHHEPMVRRLTREYVDKFIDKGEADLVNEMLWEIPLTIALHFLGVPEDDMATLREYSIAHTVNTWGKPTPEEQHKVATAVGKFWSFSGEVLERMRADPSGHGWMKYAIRKQKELPDIITDSYLHSMMMAGIVAAHETTAHATANAILLLLENREQWERICEDPSKIPLAVEECIRHSGSIIAWRRVALQETNVGGVDIKKGEKLLIVMSSANHDKHQFEDPDSVDIYRSNVGDHLSFGYGSHQCLGMNLARMEMTVFLEELTKRMPHMRLKADQEFNYLSNISFRGPDNLLVEWDKNKNPEIENPEILKNITEIKYGAPSKQSIYRDAVITDVQHEANDILLITMKNKDGSVFPDWSAGSHIELIFEDYVRKYSISGNPEKNKELQLAILNEKEGRGGSRYIHENFKQGLEIKIRGPLNSFHLNENADDYILVAGGIGVTPIVTMADYLKKIGKKYTIHFCGNDAADMAFMDRIKKDHPDNSIFYIKTEGNRADLEEIIVKAGKGSLIYACGPERMIGFLDETCSKLNKNILYFEYFSATSNYIDPSNNTEFDIYLKNSDATVRVRADQTALQALSEAGFEVENDCGEGLCGSCEVIVIKGEVEHRDHALSKFEKDEGQKMITCCSRAKGKNITIAL